MRTLQLLSAIPRRSVPGRRPKSRLAGAAPMVGILVILSPASAMAGTVTSGRSGDWSDPSTWFSGQVPLPEDEVVIAAGHRVLFTEAPDPENECARLTILPAGELSFAGPATTFQVGGNGPGQAGGIRVSGRLAIPAGVTVEIDPDGNALAAEDGLIVVAGGFLTLQGAVLYEGTVAGGVRDDNASDIVFDDPGLPAGFDLTRARLIWRSGARKGRWYDFRFRSGSRVELAYDSRSNAERTGEPDYRVGTAAVAGDVVAGTGTDWTEARANGSWWWCTSDGEAARVRVRRVDGPTGLQLAAPYGGTGCAAAGSYVLRDENQPYPAVDVTERIAPGDAYRVILPASLRSRFGSDPDFDEQIFVRVEDGAAYHFQNASFESVGREAWAAGGGSGIQIRGFDGRTDPGGVFDTVEIYRFAGDAGVEWEDSTDFDVDWIFLHWAHPGITTPNEGHGVKLEHTGPGFTFHDVRIRDARFDRTNDDFVWWATTVSGTSGVADSIGKYCPNTAAGDSCDAVDTGDPFGGAGGQLAIDRNLFTNIGADNGGSCLHVAAGPAASRPAWTGTGWVARDNVCLNIQNLACMIIAPGGQTWDREQIWAVNNVCAAVATHGFKGIPNLYQNQILDYGLLRRSVHDGIRGPYRARGNIFWGTGRRSGDSFTGNGAKVGVSLEGEANWTGTTWSLTDNVFVMGSVGVVVNSWSSSSFPAVGDARVAHNIFVPNPLNESSIASIGVFDQHEDPVSYRVQITDNVFDRFVSAGSKAGVGSLAAASDVIDSNVVRVNDDPPWTGVFVSLRDHDVTTGIDPEARDFRIKPDSGAWGVPTTDGDRPGPRFAGTLAERLPFAVPGLVPAVDPEDDDRDTDGDGLIDRWDNCPSRANPGWADANGNGKGDACDYCPPPSCSDPADFDRDGYCDACEAGALLADADNSGAVTGFDLAMLARAFGSEEGQGRYDPRVDFDRDGLVDGDDLSFLAARFGITVPPP